MRGLLDILVAAAVALCIFVCLTLATLIVVAAVNSIVGLSLHWGDPILFMELGLSVLASGLGTLYLSRYLLRREFMKSFAVKIVVLVIALTLLSSVVPAFFFFP